MARQKLYEELLCARRHGEPHQGAVQSVRRPRQHGNDPRQSDAPLPVSDGIYPDQRAATAGAESDRMAQAQVATIRTKLLKVGAQIRVTIARSGCRWRRVILGRTSTSRSGRTCVAETQ